MTTAGLSLVGFLSEKSAIAYLREMCVRTDSSADALRVAWNEARRRLGPAAPNAGRPEVLDIPAAHAPYLERVPRNPRFADTVRGMDWSFKLVEIDPLLAYQFHLYTAWGAALYGDSAATPTMEDTLGLCLPHQAESIRYETSPMQDGIRFTSDSFNLRILGYGSLGQNADQKVEAAGVILGSSCPLVQVVRCNGRCYLRTGYHRAYALRRTGVRHIPCLFLETSEFAPGKDTGKMKTFGREVLESDDPPTCGHFSDGRAYPVQLRTGKRVIQVTWTESILASDS